MFSFTRGFFGVDNILGCDYVHLGRRHQHFGGKCYVLLHDDLNVRATESLNPLSPELNPICYLLALLGAQHFLYVSRIRVKLLTLRRLMLYIYIWSTHS